MRVLVTDGEVRAVVAVARGLADGDFDVAVAASTRRRLPAAHRSDSVSERLVMPDPLRAPAAFVAAVEERVARGDIDVLIPGGDASLLAISGARERLEPHTRLGLPAHEHVQRSLDKSELAAVAARRGLDPPGTRYCADVGEALAAAHESGFPVMVKPVTSVIAGSTPRRRSHSILVDNDDELRSAVAQFGGTALVQRRVDGDVVSFAGVFAGGHLLAECYSRYHRTWYPDAGNACYSETVEASEELRRRVIGVLEELGWEGMFELELIETPERWHAIDMNPRPYGSLALAIGAGANLPASWAQYLTGASRPAVRARPGIFYRWTDADLLHGVWQLSAGHPGAAAAVLRIRRGVVHPYVRGADRGPGLARMVELGDAAIRRRLASTAARARRGRSPTLIIGAGPNGLAVNAYLRDVGIQTLCFGQPLQAWSEHMPAGMLLRSRRRSTHIADPHQELTIDEYERARRTRVSHPVLTLEEFVDYGRWFQRQVVPDVDTRSVASVIRREGAFRVRLQDGEELTAGRVIVAAGLSPFTHCPPPFSSLPDSVRSHSYEHANLDSFAGQRVAVIGSGQSALESAALLHEAGARVEVLARAGEIRWLAEEAFEGTSPPRDTTPGRRPTPGVTGPPTDVGGRASGWIAAAPDVFRRMPDRAQPVIAYRCIRPAGAGWLRPRLAEVPITCGRRVVAARIQADAVELSLDDGSARVVDHVLLGTGYRIDVRRYPFLDPSLLAELALDDGYPVLGPGLESSVAGLHFMGAPAARSFGPIMRFVVGSWYAAPAVARRVAGRRQPLLSVAFPRPARP